jgi:hypothetical protein
MNIISHELKFRVLFFCLSVWPFDVSDVFTIPFPELQCCRLQMGNGGDW